MQTITRCLALVLLCFNGYVANAQDTTNTKNTANIAQLEATKERIKNEERERLKEEVEAINKRLERNEITNDEAGKLKKEVAKKRALNIENRVAILDNKIALLKRNEDGYNYDAKEDGTTIVRIGRGENTGKSFIFIGDRKDDKPKDRKYDKRTTSDFVLAFGFNNAIVEGQSLDDSPYKFAGSRFFEIGWAWKWRVLKQSNAIRFKYGVSLQINGLKPTGNRYFMQQGANTLLQEFPHKLDKSKLSISNLVFPVHFEFGPSKKIEKEDYIRYSTRKQFKIGVGAYGGFNIGTRQKLKYDLDGQHIKAKRRGGLNTTDLVYGLSSYVAIGGTALYVKYDLSPIFRNQAVDQNNISIGVRFDMD